MTTYNHEKSVRCVVCGTSGPQIILTSSNTLEGPDLDTRPGEMLRSTMEHWLQQCHSCGYVAEDLTEERPDASAVVSSPGYKTLLHSTNYPDLARKFLLKAHMDQVLGAPHDAAPSLLSAVWACDEYGSPTQATACRKQALALIQGAFEHNSFLFEDKGTTVAILTDLLRRAALFEQSDTLIDDQAPIIAEPLIRELLCFQKYLIGRRDVGMHKISEAHAFGGDPPEAN